VLFLFQKLKVQGHGLVNWSSRTMTFSRTTRDCTGYSLRMAFTDVRDICINFVFVSDISFDGLMLLVSSLWQINVFVTII